MELEEDEDVEKNKVSSQKMEPEREGRWHVPGVKCQGQEWEGSAESDASMGKAETPRTS